MTIINVSLLVFILMFFARPISLFVQSNFRSAPEREFYAS